MVDELSTGENKVYFGECKPLLCGLEAACSPLNSSSYKCICPHDNSEPTKDLRCPNRLLVPLTPRPIHNIIPPLGANLTAKKTGLHKAKTFDSLDTRTVLLASGVACVFVIILTVICFWNRKKLSRCVSKSHHKHQNTPLSLNKTILASDRYSPNPMYIPSTVIDSQIPLLVPLLEREDIKFLQEIGEGCFGKVYKGELRSEGGTLTVAIKVLKEAASKEAEENFMREVDIMCSFHHTNILSLIGVAPKEHNKSPWMVFEFMTHGDLTEVLRNNSPHFRNTSSDKPQLTKESLMSIALQIAKGMKYLAAQRFVHRDLACRNCLVGKDLIVKIADFGMSRDVYTCDYYKIGGSRPLPVRWMSPESVMYGRFTLESDVWSYGIVLWEIFSFGKQPYFGHSNEEVVKLINQGMLPIPPTGCPQVIYDLMRSCWKTEPRDRINFIAICDELKKYLSEPRTPTQLPQPPAFPVTLQTSIDILDSEYYLQPVPPPGPAREYLQPLPD